MGAWSRDLVLDTVWWSPEFAELFGLLARRHQLFTRAPVRAAPSRRSRASVAIIGEALEQATRTTPSNSRSSTPRPANGAGWKRAAAPLRRRRQADDDRTGWRSTSPIAARAVDALQEADRRKDEFLATLAHELRNPLAPISSGLHILRRRSDPAQRAIALEIMERQVAPDGPARRRSARCGAHHDRQGRSPARAAGSRGGDRDAVETSQPLARPAPRPAVTVTPPPQPVFVNADRTRLAQVFANLLNNSAKYSEAGPADLDQRSAATATRRWSASRTPASASIPRCCRACSTCSGRPIAPAGARAAASASACRS